MNRALLLLPACLLLGACASSKPITVTELRRQAQRTEESARAAYERRNWDAAARGFERTAQTFGAMDDYAAQAAALHNQAQALRRMDRVEPARTAFQQALAINERLGRKSEQAQNLDGIALCLAAGGNLVEAIPTAERALTLAPADATLQNNLAVLLLQRGNTSDQQRILQLLTGDAPVTRLNRGRAYLQFGQIDLAQKELEAAWAAFRTLDNPHGLAETHETLARLFRERSDMARARFHLEQARQKFSFLKDDAALRRLDSEKP